MTFRMVKTIYLKEMLDMFRDRRSLISMIVVPVLAVPSLFAVVHYFTQNLGKKAQNESARVGISASVSQPGLTGALKSVGFELVPQTDARAAVENKSVAASLDLTRAADGTGQIVIYVDKTREASSIAAEKADGISRAAEARTGEEQPARIRRVRARAQSFYGEEHECRGA